MTIAFFVFFVLFIIVAIAIYRNRQLLKAYASFQNDERAQQERDVAYAKGRLLTLGNSDIELAFFSFFFLIAVVVGLAGYWIAALVAVYYASKPLSYLLQKLILRRVAYYFESEEPVDVCFRDVAAAA
jgi:hypothetical protein